MVVFNKTKRSGVKKPFRLEEIWRIRTRLEIENNLMQLRKIGYLTALSISSAKQILKFNLR